MNEEAAPTARDIFKRDTAEILRSDILIACLDQETIDSGVACEIGLAYTYGIQIIGLYTDIRQYRKGPGQMYKNLYVIGLIESVGTIVGNIEELLQAIHRFLPFAIDETSEQELDKVVLQHYGTIAPGYHNFTKRLESWYQSSWKAEDAVNEWLKRLQPRSILEIGCGTGDLARFICTNYPIDSYVGHDVSPEMISIAQSFQDPRVIFTSVLDESVETDYSFDLAMALFTLHDHPDKERSIMSLSRCIHPGGHILIIDLSTYDLPGLTQRLRYDLAKPIITHDPRINLMRISQMVNKLGLSLIECRLVLTSVSFPSAEELDHYVDVFGIYLGMDLPLGFSYHEYAENRTSVLKLLDEWNFPFIDQRGFIICILGK